MLVDKCDPEMRAWLDEMATDILARNADVGDEVHDALVMAMAELLNERPDFAFIRSTIAEVLKKPVDATLNCARIMVTDLLLRSGRQLSKLRLEDRIAIRALRKNQGLKYKELAHKFNCSIPHIANIIGGRTGALDAEVLPRPKTAAVLNALPWVTMERLTARR